MLLVSTAYAECISVYLPQSATMTITEDVVSFYNAETAILLTENHNFPGIKNMNETSIHLPLNYFSGTTYIHGFVDHKIIREKGLQYVEEYGYGFSRVPLTVEIYAEYLDEVTYIVNERVQLEELCSNSILAAAIYRINNYAGYIFYTSDMPVTRVGTLRYYNNWIPILKGDIDANGHYELGFPPGVNIYFEATTTTITNVVNTEEVTSVVIVDNTTCSNTAATNVVVVEGNNNVTTTTAVAVNGNQNNTTVVTNNSNNYALFNLVLNNESNNTVVTTNSGQQEICKPSLFVDGSPRKTNSGCG